MKKDQHVVVDLFERRKCSKVDATTTPMRWGSSIIGASSVSGHPLLFPSDSSHSSTSRNRCPLSSLIREIRTVFNVEVDDEHIDCVWGQDTVKLPIIISSLTPVLLAISPMEFERKMRRDWKRSYGYLGSAVNAPPKPLIDPSTPSIGNTGDISSRTTSQKIQPDVRKAQRDLERIGQLKSWLIQLQDILRRGSDADCYRGSALIDVSETKKATKDDDAYSSSKNHLPDMPPSPASAADENSLILPPPGALGKDAFATTATWGSVVDTITHHLNGTVVAHSTAHSFVQGGDHVDGNEMAITHNYSSNADGSVPMVSTGRYDDTGIMNSIQQQSARRKERSGARARSIDDNEDGGGGHRSNSGGSESHRTQQRSNAASRDDDNNHDNDDEVNDRHTSRDELVQGFKASMDALHYNDHTSALDDGEEEDVRNHRMERAELYSASNARFIQDMNQTTCVNCVGDAADIPQLPNHLGGGGGGAFGASSWPRDIVTRRMHISRQLLSSQESIMDVGGEDLEEAVLQLPLQIQVVGCFRIGCNNAPATSTTTTTTPATVPSADELVHHHDNDDDGGDEGGNTSYIRHHNNRTAGGCSAPLNMTVDPKVFAEATVSAVRQMSTPFVGSNNMKRAQRERLKTDPGIVTLEVPNLFGDFCTTGDDEDEEHLEQQEDTLEWAYRFITNRHLPMRNQRPSVLHKRPIVDCNEGGGRGWHATSSSSSVVRVGVVYDCIDPPLMVVERVQALERFALYRVSENEAIARKAFHKKHVHLNRQKQSVSSRKRSNKTGSNNTNMGAASPMPSQPPPMATQLALDDDRTPVRNAANEEEELSPVPQLHSRRLSRRAGTALGEEDTPIQLLDMSRVNKVRRTTGGGGFSPSTALTCLADQASLERTNTSNNNMNNVESSQDDSASPIQSTIAPNSKLARILQQATTITKSALMRNDNDDSSSDDDDDDKSSVSESSSSASAEVTNNHNDTTNNASYAHSSRFRRNSAYCLNMCAIWCAMLISPPSSGEHLLQLLDALKEATAEDIATHPAFDTILGVQFCSATYDIIRRIVLDEVNDLYDPSVIPTEQHPLGATSPAMMSSLSWVIEQVGNYRGSLFHFPLSPHQQQQEGSESHHPPGDHHLHDSALPTTPRKQHQLNDADTSSVLSAGRMPTSLTATLDKKVKMRVGLFGCVTFADVVRKLQDETSLSIRSLYQRFVDTKVVTKRYLAHVRYLIDQQKHRSNNNNHNNNNTSPSSSGYSAVVDDIFVGRQLEDLLVSPFLLTTYPPNAAIFPSEAISNMLALCNHLHVESHVGRDPMTAATPMTPRRAGAKARRSQPTSPYRSPRKVHHHEEDGCGNDDDGGMVDEVEGSVRESSSCSSSTKSNVVAGGGDDDTDEPATPSTQQQPPQTPVSYLHRSMELDINTPVYLRGAKENNEEVE